MVTRPDFSTTRPDKQSRRALIYSLTPIDLNELSASVPIIPEEIDVVNDSKKAKEALSTGNYSCVIVNRTSLDPSSERVSQFATMLKSVSCHISIELNLLPNLTCQTWKLGDDQLFHHTGEEKDVLTIPLCSMFHLTELSWMENVRAQFDRERNKLLNEDIKMVMVVGSRGTGKLSLAQIAHARSTRRNNPFIFANCKTANEQYKVKFEGVAARTLFRQNLELLLRQAQGGTIYFHEIDKLEYPALNVFAEVLTKGTFTNTNDKVEKFKGAIICSTRIPIEEKVRGEQVPASFLQKFTGHIIRVPSLMDYPDDIQPMAASMLKSISAMENLPLKQLSEEAVKVLQTHVWNSNLREMFHLLSRTVTSMGKRKIIGKDDIYFGTAPENTGEDRYEIDKIKHVLESCAGDKKKAAAKLSIARKTLYVYMKRYDIPMDYGKPAK